MKLSVFSLFLMSVFAIVLLKYIPPFERGFYCDDNTILKPYYPIIIPMSYLLLFSILIPLTFILLIEYHLKSDRKTIKSKAKQFYFGIVFTFILVLICKTYFGRLRPNAIKGICSADHYCESNTSFVPHFVCDNPIPKLAKESRMSFYSGHSSVGTYAAFYTILYICYRLKKSSNPIHLAKLVVLLIGLVPGYTQGINYWHHWSDIATGYSVGAVTAYLVINYV